MLLRAAPEPTSCDPNFEHEAPERHHHPNTQLRKIVVLILATAMVAFFKGLCLVKAPKCITYPISEAIDERIAP